MNDRENVISIIKKRGYDRMPIDFSMTPDLNGKFKQYIRKSGYVVPSSPFVGINATKQTNPKPIGYFRKFYDTQLKVNTLFDDYGVAMESGSKDCAHLRRFHHPLAKVTTIEEIESYPWPKYSEKVGCFTKMRVQRMKAKGKFVLGSMQCTVWEQSWYIRSMEQLMMDMMCEPELAEAVLDRVTHNSVIRAVNYAKAGADGIYLGDDIGMQSTTIMSEDLFVEFIKPRLKKVIDAARAVNSDILVFYHSCGYVKPFIPHLIDIGVDVLNPLQSECMNVREIISEFGDKLAFLGAIGTQTLMPFGTPDEIKKFVKETLDFAGAKGGLIIAPTHILEPEVPVENVIAYIDACKEYRPK